jgi:hypothetical protein
VNHKRGRPKNARAGCLLCKPHPRETNTNQLRRLMEALFEWRDVEGYHLAGWIRADDFEKPPSAATVAARLKVAEKARRKLARLVDRLPPDFVVHVESELRKRGDKS